MESAIYAGLPDDRCRDAFRICRDLGKRQAGLFPMADGHMADRLGLGCPQGRRVLSRLCSYKILALVERGTQHTRGQRGKTTTYQWILDQIPKEKSPES